MATSERISKLTSEAESLYEAGRTEDALVAANQALAALAREQPQSQAEADLLCKVVVGAYVARADGERALKAANQALAIAQKSAGGTAAADAWYAVTIARLAGSGEDAAASASKALGLYQDAGNKRRQAAAQILMSQAALNVEDMAKALTASTEALTLAKEDGDEAQVGAAATAVVEAHLASGNSDQAVDVAEAEYANLAKTKGSAGLVLSMGALVMAVSAKHGPDAGVEKVKSLLESLRATGDKKGEAAMLHRLACMEASPEAAMNSAQVALQLAQAVGDGKEEIAVKRTLTDLYAAKGKVEKAPNRKEALAVLAELGQDLEAKNGDRFEETYKRLSNFWNALTQNDFDKVIFKVVRKDEKEYTKFLQDHGIMAGEEEKEQAGPTGKMSARPVPTPVLYMGFRFGGLGYGPRFRCCVPAYKKIEEIGAIGIVTLQDCSDDWERELAYSSSLMDCTLQTGSAMGHDV